MVRLASYVRQSARRESGSEASPATQREAVDRRANADYPDVTWVGRFEDIGISGYKDVERPDFDRLCALVTSGGVDVVIVHYMSRLTRQDVKLSLPLLMGWLAAGVTIVSVNEGAYRNDNIGDLIGLVVSLDRGHKESDNKSKAVRAAKALARRHGGYTGKPPYGYRLTPDMVTSADGRQVVIRRLTLDPSEGPTVRRIVAEATAGKPIGRIAADLNAAGAPTRGMMTGKRMAGSAWSPRTVERIVRDPRIAGLAVEIEYGTTADGRKSSKAAAYRIERESDGTPVVAHPEIIPTAAWFTLQASLDRRVHAPGPAAPPRSSLLSSLDILFCECGARMKSHRNGETGYRSCYRCTRPSGVLGGAHLGDCTISQRALDQFVASRVFDLIASADPGEHFGPDPTAGVLYEASRRFAARNADPNAVGERAAFAADLASAEADLDDHLAVFGAWRNRRDGWHRRVDALNAAIESLRAALAEHDAAQTPVLLTLDAWISDSDSGPMGDGSWWAGASLADRRAFVSLFVRRIVVRKGNRPRPGKARPVVDGGRVTIEFVGGQDNP